MKRLRRLFLLCVIALISLFLPAQFFTPAISAGSQDTAMLKDPAELKSLKYRLLGPAWGGRVSRAVGVPGDPNTFYFAGAASGVWKSTNGGLNWRPIFDDQPISSIGSIAVAPSDPNVLYVGSGEANIRGNVAPGNGIYKSIDAGKTWTHVWKQVGQIGTMAVHPANPDIAWAAVLGHAFGPNPERGVYRTRDGGKTWEQVLQKDENTGAADVAIDPSNPNIVFAGLWQARRFPWDMNSGGPGSGLYMSRDGGDTWTQLDGKDKGKGLPEGSWGKVGVAIAPADGRRVYALIEADKGGLFRSDDGGDSWSLASSSRLIRQRAWYYSTITVHPQNPNELWMPNVPMIKSIDGGKTPKMVKGFHHGDHHDIWIDPKNPKRMINANDGGVDISTDGGETWYAPALPISQFYHVSADNRVPFSVSGAIQDIGTAQGPNNSLSFAGIRNTDWYRVGGGEAGWVVSDPSDPNIVYAGEYAVRLTVEGKTLTTALKLAPDPRMTMTDADYKTWLAFGLGVCDDVTRLTRIVNQIRLIRQQLLTRSELLKDDSRAATLTRDSTNMIARLTELEEKLHNPKAEVFYDILAFRGGAKLYSRLAPLCDWAVETDGLPTQGMREVYAERKKELDQYEAEFKKLAGAELGALNDNAKKSGYPQVVTTSGNGPAK
ncbi:MAG: WD40/YVTN/BNR-like repeat-containing protein [Blastocatellia bacterium]